MNTENFHAIRISFHPEPRQEEHKSVEKKMDDQFIQYVDYRINRWVSYYSRDKFYGVGFYDRSLIHCLMTEGVVISSTAPRSICDEDAEEV